MRARLRSRVGWQAGVALVVLAGAPARVVGQVTVPIAIPTGTNTYNNVIPATIQLPPPPPAFQNPLGLTAGFYSINLGKCFGELSSSTCSGAFLTHAAPTGSTVGVLGQPNPLASAQETFGPLFGGSPSEDIPAVTSSTMPGWSLFVMNFGTAQQALSVADFTSTIEMPRSQQFPGGNLITSDWRNHSFSRSADYSELKVSYPLIVNTQGNPPFQRLLSLKLSAANNGNNVFWETTTITGSSFQLATGMGTVTAGDLNFGFGPPPPPLTDAQKLERLLTSINLHLLTDEPTNARETWLGLNPLGVVAHDEWRRITLAIQQELPDLVAGKESNLLTADGALRLSVRPNMDQFLLPEPTPVPEPSTLALLGIGVAGVGLARRRRG